MGVPAYPYNRHEQYLNRIATGEGDIPPYPQNREEEYLNAIVENGGGGGGSSLPEVTADDNGDVLTVVEGAWEKAAPSGGGGVLIVDLTQDENTLVYTAQKTAGEIYAACVNGLVIFRFAYGEAGTDYEEQSELVTGYVYKNDSEGDYYSFYSRAFDELTAESSDAYPSTPEIL